MKRTGKRILIRIAILAPMLLGAFLLVKPIESKAWRWYKPWTWPLFDYVYYGVSDNFTDPSEGCPSDDELMARVMIEGEDGARDFYTQTAIAWNYAVARAEEGKKVSIKLESNWNARSKEMRTQYPSPLAYGSDRAWLVLHKYDMGADMRYKDIPYLNSSSTSKVDAFQDGGILVPNGCNISIDLNGYSIWRKAEDEYIDDGEVFHVAKNATLTLVDSNPGKKYDVGNVGTVSGGHISGGSSNNGAGGIQIKNGATVYIEGVTFCNNSSSNDGGAIKIDGEDARLFISGTRFVHNNAATGSVERNHGGAIACYDAEMEIRNATFEKNWAENRGGAIFNEDGGLTLIECNFKGNSAEKDYGGAMYLSSGSDDKPMRLDDNVLTQNLAQEGGGIYFDTDAIVKVSRMKSESNKAYQNGGAMYISGKGVFLYNAEFEKNVANDAGGGVYVDSLSDFKVMGKIKLKNNNLISGDRSNLCLQNGKASQARIQNGGLTEGTQIGVNIAESKRDESAIVAENIDRYAYDQGYFFADNGTLSYDQKTVSVQNTLASLIGTGSFQILVIIGVPTLLLLVCVFIYARRRKGRAADQAKGILETAGKEDADEDEKA